MFTILPGLKSEVSSFTLDELGCFDGGDFWISRQGIRQWEQKELPVPLNEAGEWFLRALWCGSEEGAAWSYQTSAPHSTFKCSASALFFLFKRAIIRPYIRV